MEHENDRPENYTGPAMNITEAAEEVTLWYILETGCSSADEIMSGCCREWSDAVIERVPEAELGYGDGHCWVEYDGLVYDAESPSGVEESGDLPFFAERGCKSAWID